nr:hypothetical protein [Tanacetum cinerariifolium]
MSPSVEETLDAGGSVRITVHMEEVIERDFSPGSVPPEIV